MNRASYRILVTGANGFIGTALCGALCHTEHVVRRAVRHHTGPHAPDIVAVGNVGSNTNWSAALEGIDVILHLAGRAHVMRADASDVARRAYYMTNAEGTECLARAALIAGVRRLVFVSTIKVNGEQTSARAFTENDPPAPEDDYGRSKWEAEQRLAGVARGTGLETVVVRPPLVYGPGVKGNILRLMKLIDRRLPLPLGGIDNQRSLIGLSNMAQALIACIEHPEAAGETFLISDGEDLSTPDLVRALAHALRRPARLLPVPGALLGGIANATGFAALKRLTGSLRVDSTHIQTRIGWRPTTSVEAEFAVMAQAFLASKTLGDASAANQD